MRKYKGFVFDIDETIVPNGALNVESKELISVFKNLPKDVIAIAATGRKKSSALPVVKSLNLKHESVIANGAQIIDSLSGQTIYSQNLTLEQVKLISNICADLNYNLFQNKSYSYSDSVLIIKNVNAKEKSILLNKINSIDNVFAYSATAWSNPKNFDIGIGNSKAKKHFAIEILYQKYNLKPSEMIGVGDGLNDTELFKVVGHKIAVANANPILLKQADEVVPSQKENGIIKVINKYFS